VLQAAVAPHQADVFGGEVLVRPAAAPLGGLASGRVGRALVQRQVLDAGGGVQQVQRVSQLLGAGGQVLPNLQRLQVLLLRLGGRLGGRGLRLGARGDVVDGVVRRGGAGLRLGVGVIQVHDCVIGVFQSSCAAQDGGAGQQEGQRGASHRLRQGGRRAPVS
jgi:hypothetical protein